jgi:hypothetical protein
MIAKYMNSYLKQAHIKKVEKLGVSKVATKYGVEFQRFYLEYKQTL